MVTPVKREDKALVCVTVIVLKPWSSVPGQGLPDGQKTQPSSQNNSRLVGLILRLLILEIQFRLHCNRVLSGMPT